ncbi:MAG: hypothetical protein ABR549_19735 [Mycobacteriales bacterium]
MSSFVVQQPDGQVLAVFAERDDADRYACARPGRTVAAAPFVAEPLAMTTVHTRWVEVDATGAVCNDEHDSYQWCPELDAEDPPPVAEIEQYSDGRRRRVLAVGTDGGLLAERLAEALSLARTTFSQTRIS